MNNPFGIDRPSWDEFYLTLTDAIALRSKDTSTKVGAVIVRDRAILAMGYNGMPRGSQAEFIFIV